jgi:hypothetical protein
MDTGTQMLIGLTQPRGEGAGDPWQAGDPSSPEFWGRVAANNGAPEPADVTAARDAQGTRPPRMPDASATEPALATVAAPMAEASPARAPAPAPAATPSPRTAARPWSTRTIEETTLQPAQPQPQPVVTVPEPQPAARVPRVQTADAAEIEAIRQRWRGAPAAPTPAAPAAAAPAPAPPAAAPVAATPTPAPAQAPAQAAPPAAATPEGNPVDRQLAAQGMTRRSLSEQELLDIRAALSSQPPNEAPRFNPLQAYPLRNRSNVPRADWARDMPLDAYFGHDPRNQLTNREILEDVERQLAELRQ